MKIKVIKISVLVLILLLVTVIHPFYALSIIGEGAEAFPPYIGQKANYRLYVQFEKKLKVFQTISLLFPPGFQYQKPGQSSCPYTNEPEEVQLHDDGSIELIFKTTIEIDPEKEGYDHITITIAEHCGFTNPSKPGLYPIKIKTEVEPTWTLLGEMVIIKPNPPGVYVTENGRKGLGEWYLEKPELWMEAIDYSSDVVYCINQRDIQNPSGVGKVIKVYMDVYRSKQLIVDVYYAVVSKDGTISNWDLLTYYIDMVPPVFFLNCSDSFQTISEEFLLQGAIKEETINDRGTFKVLPDHVSSIKINQKSIEYNQKTNQFSTNLQLNPGENTFQIEVTDQAGNKTEKEITIIRNN